MKTKVPLVYRHTIWRLVSIAAIIAFVLVQIGELVDWIVLQEEFLDPTTNELVALYLVDKRTEPESRSNTVLDQPLALKYNESCVQFGRDHVEYSLRAPVRCFTRTEVQRILIDLTLTTSAMFTKLNITYFLDSGTLLGAVRHKNVIPFDQDADIGIDEQGYEILKTTRVLFPSAYSLHVYDTVYITQERGRLNCLCV